MIKEIRTSNELLTLDNDGVVHLRFLRKLLMILIV